MWKAKKIHCIKKSYKDTQERLKSTEKEYIWHLEIEVVDITTGAFIRKYNEDYCGSEKLYIAYRESIRRALCLVNNVSVSNGFAIDVEGGDIGYYNISDNEMFSKIYFSQEIK